MLYHTFQILALLPFIALWIKWIVGNRPSSIDDSRYNCPQCGKPAGSYDEYSDGFCNSCGWDSADAMTLDEEAAYEKAYNEWLLSQPDDPEDDPHWDDDPEVYTDYGSCLDVNNYEPLPF